MKKKIDPNTTDAISETTKKLGYINLIQGLRKLNEKRENENENAIKDN